MHQPSVKQIATVTSLLKEAFCLLDAKDRELYSSRDGSRVSFYNDFDNLNKVIDNKLHEITLNHRLAHYIENLLLKHDLKNYFVDIEYNRNHSNAKNLLIKGKLKLVRPDIIVHSRTNNSLPYENYLVIEAKKAKPSSHDISKVKAFIKESNYKYLFGATVSYSVDASKISCELYYCEDSRITSHQI